jgi:omega-6 fatty acid desaturase (delta-12 desaturase)
MSPPLTSAEPSPNRNRLPTKPPPFTKGQLKAKIPPHCFVRSTFTSSLYLAVDIVGVAILYYLSTWIPFISDTYSPYIAAVLWPIYWVFQGGVGTGLWVIGHECGHRAYSDSVFVCDLVGLVVHSILLVPYHPWRISHAKHHSTTGNIDKDEAFVPARLSSIKKNKLSEDPSSFTLIKDLVLMFVFGWWVYLFTHATGRDYGRSTNHFSPNSPLFTARDYKVVMISNAALVTVISILGVWVYYTSFWHMFFTYFIPYMVVNFWLLLYTFLHHTDPKIPRYTTANWEWMLGALTTVDRDYGIWNYFHHDIGNTHVLHHLFSKIPHYHAKEATEAIKPLLGQYYYECNDPIWKVLWNSTKVCQWVDDVNVQSNVDPVWFGPEK